ncbi:MAG: carbohydrate binding family 9 domain-containing protein [bacterium]|nr:carbohydrate binding family 9 domain-containing protein [bacterium]
MTLISGFVQYSPYNGKKPSQRTEARVGYDETALYVGITCYDDTPGNIRRGISVRDQLPPGYNADSIAVHIDPFNNGLTSVQFGLSAAGVQRDTNVIGDYHDIIWDAIWESKVRITDFGWVCEMKIPLAALRFSSQPVQDWGFNIWRWLPETQEWVTWSPVAQDYPGWWRKPGELKGLKGLKAARRFSITPYLSAYLEGETHRATEFLYNGGVDIKYGLTESFTLDSNIIPDFGQVQSDDQELNLSPFEIKYNENRQFFTEGTDLFNKGDLFYSRRIGTTPSGHDKPYAEITGDEEVTKNPQETQLINATKISGRTNSGLGIGVLNAMTANTHATITNRVTGQTRKIKTQPFTNYNIVILDQILRAHSYVSLVNSNVLRKDYVANVSAVDFRLADKDNTYAINGIGAYSQIHNGDADKTGYKLLLNGGKIGGPFQATYNLSLISDNYDQNDLGFLLRNNEVANNVTFKHIISKPFGSFLGLRNTLRFNYNRVYKPGAFSEFNVYYQISGLFKNQYFLSLYTQLVPVDRNDYYEPRIPGRFFVNHKYYKLGVLGESDPRNKFFLRVYHEFTNAYDYDFNVKSTWTGIEPLIRFNNHLNVSWSFAFGRDKNQPGFVSYDAAAGNIYFGKRDRRTIVNTMDILYLFTNKLELKCRLRHYWSKAEYDSYHELSADGHLASTGYNGNHNINFNLFNIDLTLRWHFAPGSQIVLNWKNSITTVGQELIRNYWTNFTNTLEEPQVNSLSVKIIYYFDI